MSEMEMPEPRTLAEIADLNLRIIDAMEAIELRGEGHDQVWVEAERRKIDAAQGA